MDDKPKSLEELMDYIEKNADAIYVREELDGRWQSLALTELPPAAAIRHAFAFLRRWRNYPTLVRTSAK